MTKEEKAARRLRKTIREMVKQSNLPKGMRSNMRSLEDTSA